MTPQENEKRLSTKCTESSVPCLFHNFGIYTYEHLLDSAVPLLSGVPPTQVVGRMVADFIGNQPNIPPVIASLGPSFISGKLKNLKMK
jgi:hypothetical protein